MAKLAPFTKAPKTPGLSLTRRRCFLLNVEWMAGSMYIMGVILLGSPTLAMPLKEDEPENRKLIEQSLKRGCQNY